MTSGFSWGLPTAAAQVGPAMAKNAMTPEEQLEDLQRRFQLLEGDSSSQLREFEFEHERVSAFCMLCALDACRFQERKATYETAKLNIQQNKDS